MNMLIPSTMQDFGQLMNLPSETIYNLSQVGVALSSLDSKVRKWYYITKLLVSIKVELQLEK